MPAWFSKLFKSDEAASPAADVPAPERSAALTPGAAPAPAPRKAPMSFFTDEDETPVRRVIEPTVLVEPEEQSAWTDDIRIKARFDRDGRGCVFLVDRPVLEGVSAWFEDIEAAAAGSPLALALFEVDGVESVLLHGMTVTVGRDPMRRDDWEPWSREIGARIRSHLKSGAPVLTEDFRRQIPPEDEIRSRLERVIQQEINPGIAAHSGAIALERVEGNTAYIRMLGGCQGCAASTITLRQGIHQAFRDAVPGLGAILDQTDHASGQNPFYRSLPAGMDDNA